MKRLLAAGAVGLLLASGSLVAAQAEPGPNGSNDHGLCTAYFNGSDQGQAQKHNAPPFQGLEQAASDSNQSVEEFCEGLVGGRAGRE